MQHEVLARVHYLRMTQLWGRNWAYDNAFTPDRWPADEKAWRQLGHGHPADTNVEMAKVYLSIAKQLKDEDLL